MNILLRSVDRHDARPARDSPSRTSALNAFRHLHLLCTVFQNLQMIYTADGENTGVGDHGVWRLLSPFAAFSRFLMAHLKAVRMSSSKFSREVAHGVQLRQDGIDTHLKASRFTGSVATGRSPSLPSRTGAAGTPRLGVLPSKRKQAVLADDVTVMRRLFPSPPGEQHHDRQFPLPTRNGRLKRHSSRGFLGG